VKFAFVAALALVACSSTSGGTPDASGAAGGGGGRGAGGASTAGTTGAAGGGGAGAGGVDAAAGAPADAGGTDLSSNDRTEASFEASSAPDATDAFDASDAPALPPRVLLYSYGTLDIPTLPAQLAFFKAKLESWQLTVDESKDPAAFTDDNLTRYGAVAMVNTCFWPFGDGKPGVPEAEALQRFVRKGGGLFGTHCAAVTFQAVNPPHLYNQLIGGRGGNGFFDGQSACRKADPGMHPSTVGLPATFTFNGNLDNTDYLAPDTTVLVRCTWSMPTADAGRDVAVSWFRTEGAGRVFYSNFGKIEADLEDATLGAKHLVPALAWVLRR